MKMWSEPAASLVCSPMVTLNMADSGITWLKSILNCPDSAKSPKFMCNWVSFIIASPESNWSPSSAPVSMSAPPSSTVIELPVASVTSPSIVNVAPLSTMRFPFMVFVPFHVSSALMMTVVPSLGTSA